MVHNTRSHSHQKQLNKHKHNTIGHRDIDSITAIAPGEIENEQLLQ